MITLDNIALSHGSQILYTGASMGLFAGEKVGLVGPQRRRQVDHLSPDRGRGAAR